MRCVSPHKHRTQGVLLQAKRDRGQRGAWLESGLCTGPYTQMSQHGIHTIDTAFQRDHFDAAYLVVEQGRGAFIDCGTNHSVPKLPMRWKPPASTCWFRWSRYLPHSHSCALP